MKLRFENIFEAITDDPIRAKDLSDRANVLSAVRDLIVACQWDFKVKINICVDKDSIVISRGTLKPNPR